MASPLLGPPSSISSTRRTRPKRFYSDNPSIHIFNSRESRQSPFNSDIEFLGTQITEIEASYKTWEKYYVISVIIAIMYSLALGYFWFHWVLEIVHETEICHQLKLQIIWVSIVFLCGIGIYLIGIVLAHQKALNWFIGINVLILVICIVSIKIHLEAVNSANLSLEGCVKANVKNISGYIYTTVAYCSLNMGLVAQALKLIHILKKRKKAQRLYEDYMMKAEKQATSFM